VKETESVAAIGALVSKQRVELALSQKGLAALADVDVKTLRSLENGERWPQPVNRYKIETALGWRQGAMAEIRDNDDAHATLANLQTGAHHDNEDWPHDVEQPVKRAAQLTDAELLSELTYRFNMYARTTNEAEPAQEEQENFGLAAMAGPNRGKTMRQDADAAGEESQEPADNGQHQ